MTIKTPSARIAARRCPQCGEVCFWRFGLVAHAGVIHVKIRNQPREGGCIMILATIVELAREARERGRKCGK